MSKSWIYHIFDFHIDFFSDLRKTLSLAFLQTLFVFYLYPCCREKGPERTEMLTQIHVNTKELASCFLSHFVKVFWCHFAFKFWFDLFNQCWMHWKWPIFGQINSFRNKCCEFLWVVPKCYTTKYFTLTYAEVPFVWKSAEMLQLLVRIIS